MKEKETDLKCSLSSLPVLFCLFTRPISQILPILLIEIPLSLSLSLSQTQTVLMKPSPQPQTLGQAAITGNRR